MQAKGNRKWENVMQAKHETLMKTQAWAFTDLPAGKKPIRCKWVYKIKYKAYGTLGGHKVSLVEKGFAQKEGNDYEETIVHTEKMETILLVLMVAAQFS
jgi:hypothetical protein